MSDDFYERLENTFVFLQLPQPDLEKILQTADDLDVWEQAHRAFRLRWGRNWRVEGLD